MRELKNDVRQFVCIAGKNNIAVDVLEYLLQYIRKDDLGVVCNRTEEGINGFQKSLRWFAQKEGVREYALNDMYDIENLLFFSLEFDQLVKPEKFKNARMFNIHFSMLPQYKGMYTAALPILNGERESGVTFHRISSGIDTGDIIDQQAFRIEGLDVREVYMRCIKLGTEVVIRNLQDIISGKEISFPQSVEGSTYYSRKSIDYRNIKIDLNQTAFGIGRQIRAYRFREYQLPNINGHSIIDYEYTSIRSDLKPGTILFDTQESCIIATIDYNLILYYDRFNELLDACRQGDIEVVHNICVVKRHINEKDKHGWTPLIVATYYNRTEVVRFLIAHGANIYVVNNNGTTLLMYAKEAYRNTGDNSLFKLYISLGLSKDIQDYNGFNLAHYLERNNINLADLLK